MNASREALVEMNADESRPDVETIFQIHYARIARVIARVLRDPSRAEELAVEVFLRWPRKGPGENTKAWLYRVAVRTALDELRRESRRTKRERLTGFFRPAPTPEDIRASKEEQEQVRAVLSAIRPPQAELLVLRSQGLSYEELAAALSLNPASIGTFLSRAEQSFRKEYVKRYGQQ